METQHRDATVTSVRTDIDRRTSSSADIRLQFRPITDDTMPLINSILQTGSSRTCDYTVGGIYMWVEWFKYTYCVIDETLFIKGVAENDPTKTAFSLPIGPMPLEKAVRLIKEYCREQHIPTLFSAIPEDRIDYLIAAADDNDAQIQQLDDYSDYLYNINDLATLSGKRYNKKRNHIHRFMEQNPDYTFEPLTYDILPEVLLFHTGHPITDDTNPAMAQYEKDKCTRVLNRYNSYPFEGAVLRDQNGQICAYTAGEIIGDTLYIHIEKMDHNIPGSGETINHLYAIEMQRRHPHLRYINREEDCGDPGLRQAKQSYNPAALLHKYNIQL